YAAAGSPLEEAFAAADALFEPAYLSEDAQEGPRAFREGRPPTWLGPRLRSLYVARVVETVDERLCLRAEPLHASELDRLVAADQLGELSDLEHRPEG